MILIFRLTQPTTLALGLAGFPAVGFVGPNRVEPPGTAEGIQRAMSLRTRVALPFLTQLAPSERYHQKRGTRHKKLIDWAKGLIGQVRRW